MKPKLSIVVPVYNESRTLEALLTRLLTVDLGEVDREIIVVDDGSCDDCCEIACRLETGNGNAIRVRRNPINLGKGAAVRHGFSAATGDIVTVQDGDLELDPADYPKLLAPILAGQARVVYGSRFKSPGRRFPRRTRWSNGLLTLLTNVLYGTRLTDMETCYKMMRREVLDGLRLRCVGFDFEPDITSRLARAGHTILEVPIRYNPRGVADGKTISWRDGLDAVYTLFKNRFF